jgi:hypothetical protein
MSPVHDQLNSISLLNNIFLTGFDMDCDPLDTADLRLK